MSRSTMRGIRKLSSTTRRLFLRNRRCGLRFVRFSAASAPPLSLTLSASQRGTMGPRILVYREVGVSYESVIQGRIYPARMHVKRN
jgi:hypothetical protein